jgi:uracil-DNA glycosylase
VDPGWKALLESFLQSPQGHGLADFVAQRIASGAVVYPQHPLYALELTPLASVRVVILGQDPYHGPGQAQGLAFSVASGMRLPPSLRNIFKELHRDLGLVPPGSGSLRHWARQGVLLLNTCLSVEDARPASHSGQGWEALTDEIVRQVESVHQHVVFLLWGAHAQKKQAMLQRSVAAGHVLFANHPSPLSASRPPVPFIGCGHFGQANRLLQSWGRGEIDWCA